MVRRFRSGQSEFEESEVRENILRWDEAKQDWMAKPFEIPSPGFTDSEEEIDLSKQDWLEKPVEIPSPGHHVRAVSAGIQKNAASSVSLPCPALCPVPCALCPVPCALCPVPCALCPVPCALCPVPCPALPCALPPCPACPALPCRPAPCLPCHPCPRPLPPAPCPLPPAPCPLPPAPCPLPLPGSRSTNPCKMGVIRCRCTAAEVLRLCPPGQIGPPADPA